MTGPRLLSAFATKVRERGQRCATSLTGPGSVFRGAPACTLVLLVCTQGEVAYLFIVSATERQWNSSEPVLRTVLESFRA